MGEIKGPEYYRQLYSVDAVHYADEILQILTDLKPPALHVLHGKNTDRCDHLGTKNDSKVHAWTHNAAYILCCICKHQKVTWPSGEVMVGDKSHFWRLQWDIHRGSHIHRHRGVQN